MRITFQQLEALRAVVLSGSFEAGAKSLNKTHPSVVTAIKNLEAQLGVILFNRDGYRAVLTSEGREIYKSALRVIEEAGRLLSDAQLLSRGENLRVEVVIGDVTPTTEVLKILQDFLLLEPNVKINLHYENLSVPVEKMLQDANCLIVHHIDKADPRIEYLDFCDVEIIPVAAPLFLGRDTPSDLRYDDMKEYKQCVLRDNGFGGREKSFYLIEGARAITVADQFTKKEIIKLGIGWGHMADYMIAEELKNGSLISIAGRYIKKRRLEIAVARLAAGRRSKAQDRLWETFGRHLEARKEIRTISNQLEERRSGMRRGS